MRGRRDRAQEHLQRSRSLVERERVSESKARVLANLSRYLMLAGEGFEAVRVGREAMAMAEQLGLEEVQAHVLNNIGCARAFSGDSGGIADVQQSINLARAINSPDEFARALNNLSSILFQMGDLQRSRALRAEASDTEQRFGTGTSARYARGVLVTYEFFAGNWDKYVPESAAFLAESERSGRRYQDTFLAAYRSLVLLARGEEEQALEEAQRGAALARDAGDPQALTPALSHLVWVEAALGRLADARRHALDCLEIAGNYFPAEFAFLALRADQLELEEELSKFAETALPGSAWVHVLRLLLDREYEAAADALREMAVPPYEALARLRAAEQLVGLGRRAEADVQLQLSLAFWRAVGATRYIREGEALLAASA
jgi:tetratricopeptide (TPR) repeat protein